MEPRHPVRSFLRRTLRWLLREPHEFSGGFAGHYVEWRRLRLAAIVRHFGPAWFHGKRVLELGAGYGDIGAFFSKLGADVTCIEGRTENVAVMKARYPSLRGIRADLDGQWPIDESFDLVLHLGLLYHLSEPEKSLRLACEGSSLLVLETEVSDSTDSHYVVRPEESAGYYDQALGGVGSRPSPAFIERVMQESGMTFERLEDGSLDLVQPELQSHFYAWPVGNSGRWEHGWRKFWFARKTLPAG